MDEGMAEVVQPEGIKVWRPQEFAGLEVELFESVPSLEMPPIYFDGFYEMTVARAGNFSFRYIKTKRYLVPKEDLFVVQHPGETARITPLDDAPATARTLRFYPEAMAEAKRALNLKQDSFYFPSMFTEEHLNAPISQLVSKTLMAFDRNENHLECESRLLRLTHAVLTHCSDTPPPEEKLGREHQAVSLIKEVVQAHYEQELKLTHLSQLTNLSTFYLIRVFQRDVGLSPHEHQTGLRIHHAKNLLAKGEKIADVAYNVGFNDQAHLTRTFRDYTQTTPGRFQRWSLAG